MGVEICEHSDMPVYSCVCPKHGGNIRAKSTETAHPPPEYEGPRPPKDAILISQTSMAHWYGCDHLPDYDYLVPPKWGWIEDRSLWPQIGQRTVPATGGNPDRVAERRCSDCDH